MRWPPPRKRMRLRLPHEAGGGDQKESPSPSTGEDRGGSGRRSVNGLCMKTTEALLSDRLSELRAAADGPPADIKIAVISTPRCGSKLFCESLASTGRFGQPREWMNPRYLKAYAQVFGVKDVTARDYLRFVMSKTTTANGVFTLNFHVEQYMSWRKKGIDLLDLKFDKLFYVFRKDKLAQALSLAKARLTDQWTAGIEPRRNVAAPEIKTSAILRALHDLSVQEEFYDAHLARHVDCTYCYEDYAASDACFHDVLERAGIEHRDVASFSSGRIQQRGDDDAARLRDLVAYLGR